MAQDQRQARLEADHKAAIKVDLDGPGPHLLPQCISLEAAYLYQHKFVIRLESDTGQSILLPLDAKAVVALLGSLNAYTKWPSTTTQ